MESWRPGWTLKSGPRAATGRGVHRAGTGQGQAQQNIGWARLPAIASANLPSMHFTTEAGTG